MSVEFNNLVEAIKEAKSKAKKRNFVESVELIVNLKDIDLKDPSNRFSLNVLMPHPVDKKLKIVAITEGEMTTKAKNLGIDKIIEKDELNSYMSLPKEAKKLAKKYDFFLAITTLMPLVGRVLGRYLGPRNKMPQPIPPGVDLAPFVDRLKRTARLRLKQNPVVQARIGTVNMTETDLAENAQTIINAIKNKVQSEHRIKSLYVKTTMGPPVKVR